MISVRIDGVVKRFGQTAALKGVSLEIEPGELFFLLGPSGGGKTTLLRCLAGFYRPDSGRIFFGDEEVTRVAPHKRHAGMVFQNYALWPHMTVWENVAFGLKQRSLKRGEIRERVAEALSSVRMESYADRKPNQLSGGQQQRVALARALVVRPRCLLLDEPLSNLDAKLRQEMRAEIRRVCKDFQLTTVYVTHDQKEALSIADRMAVLADGEILQVGTPPEVYRRPRTPFVAAFIGESNFVQGSVVRSGAGFVSVATELGEIQGVAADPEREYAEGASVTVAIRPESLQLDQMPPDENCFAGTVGEATYYGEVVQYVFESAGQELKVFQLNPRHVYREGMTGLFAWVDAEDVSVILD